MKMIRFFALLLALVSQQVAAVPVGLVPPAAVTSARQDDGIRDIVIFLGDSNEYGSALDENTLVYTPDAKVQVLNASKVFATYTPGTLTGLHYYGNEPHVGPELGFAKRYRADFPNKTLYICKFSANGSTQGRGPTIATITGSVSGGTLTVTSGTVAAYQGLTGAGIPLNTYITASSGGNTWTLNRTGITATGSISIQTYDAGLAWSPDYSDSLFTSYAFVTAAKAAIVAAGYQPRILAIINDLGTNDAADATSAGYYAAAFTSMLSAMRTNYGTGKNTLIIQTRTSTNGYYATNEPTIRAAQLAASNADSLVRLLNVDNIPRNAAYGNYQAVHYNLAGQLQLGSNIYDLVKPAIDLGL